MAFSKEIYEKIEAIVGKRNVSQDPAVLQCYRCITPQSSAHYGPYDLWTPTPQAVVLPASVEEVSEVIKLCNEYDIHFKASTTFWSAMGYISTDYSIQFDMKRMCSVEIDVKNRLAICEPYAITGAVQAEAMKHGLNCNVAGVGASSSMLAGTAGWFGFGPTSVFMGASGENMLAAEWVTPAGDIIRSGSLGAGAGWFCGEGPGPSTRAILRGFLGNAGTTGVCTKVAVRLHPWPGPDHIPTRGTAPAYKVDGLDNFKCYTLCYPDWASYAEGVRLFHENDVIYLGHRQFNLFGRDMKTAMLEVLTDPEKQFCDIPALMADERLKKINDEMKIEHQIMIAGFSEDDLEYKEAAVEEIMRRTGAKKSEYMMDKEMDDWVRLYLLRLGHKNLNYTLCGAYEGSFGMSPNVFVATKHVEEAAMLKKKWEQDRTGIAAVGGDSVMGSISLIGGGGMTGWEFFVHFDAYDKSSINDVKDHIDATQEWMFEKGLGVDFGRVNAGARRADQYDYTQDEQDEMFSKLAQPLVAEYQWKVRNAFNPNNLTGTYYSAKTPSESK